MKKAIVIIIVILVLCACVDAPSNKSTSNTTTPKPTIAAPTYPIKVLRRIRHVQVGYSVEYGYDYRGLLTSEKEKGSEYYNDSISYEYDDAGKLISMTKKSLKIKDIHEYIYDENGFLVKESVNHKISGSGSKNSSSYTINYTNDSAGRLVKKSSVYKDGVSEVVYCYDDYGRVASETKDNVSAIYYEYDAEGRLISKQSYDNNQLQYTTTYKYNSNGSVEITNGKDKTLVEYDSDGDILRNSKYNPDGTLTLLDEYQYWYIIDGDEYEVAYREALDN